MESYNSFPASLNRDDTFATWYQDIRVDFLADDELAFELAVRDILVEGDRSQMRRCLRAKLKAEKQDGIGTRTLKTDPTIEVQKCKDKLGEIERCLVERKKDGFIVCRDRLLHLGARAKLVFNQAPDALKDDLVSVFTIVTDHLYYFFYKSVSFEPEQQESEEEDDVEEDDIPSLEDLLKDIPDDVETVQIDRKVLLKEVDKRKRAEESEKWFKAEVNNLEYRLQASMEAPQTWNAQVQTDPVDPLGNASVFSAGPSHIPAVPSTSSSRWTPKDPWAPTNRSFLGMPRSYSSGMGTNSGSLYTNVPTTSWSHLISSVSEQPSMYKVPPPPPSANPSAWGDPYHKWGNPSMSFPPFMPPLERSHYSNPFNLNSSQIQPTSANPWNTTAVPPHHTLPVSKWAIEKYSGEDQGLNLNEFLFKVKSLALSERVSDAVLFDSALHLFSGPALNWYQTMRSTGRLYNWDHLVMELRCAFVHPDLDNIIKMKVYLRKQQRNESFQSYYL